MSVMGKLVRRFATRVILLHLFGLLAIIAMVLGAAAQIYRETRERVLDQAASRQQLIAGQTSRAVSDFFDGILSNLDLVRRSEGATPLAPWELRNRRAPFPPGMPGQVPGGGHGMGPGQWNDANRSMFAVERGTGPAEGPGGMGGRGGDGLDDRGAGWGAGGEVSGGAVWGPGGPATRRFERAMREGGRFGGRGPEGDGDGSSTQPGERLDRVMDRLSETEARMVARGSAELLWRQLESRATHLLSYQTANRSYQLLGHSEGAADASRVVVAFQDFFEHLTTAQVSPARTVDGAELVAVCAPVVAPDGRRRVLAAIVPVREVVSRFLEEISVGGGLYYAVYDSGDGIVATSDKRIPRVNPEMARASGLKPRLVTPLKTVSTSQKTVSTSLKTASTSLKTVSTQPTSGQGRSGLNPSPASQEEQPQIVTQVIERPLSVSGVKIAPGIVVLADIDMEGPDWRFVLASPLSDVDTVLASLFRKAMFWSGFLVMASAGLLISTSTLLIRDRVRLEREQQASMERDLHKARKIQLEWLPASFPTSDRLEVAAVNVPANHVSGDLYNWFEVDEHQMAFVIGDVTGHGLSAAMQMSSVQLLVRAAVRPGVSAGEALTQVNATLCLHDFKGQFVTLLIAILDTRSGRMQVATAGHPYPLMSDETGFAAAELEPELMLGVDSSVSYPTQELNLSSGQGVVFYTDGLTEALSEDGELYSLGRVLKTLTGEGKATPRRILDRLVADIQAYQSPGQQIDDLTAMAIRWQGPEVGVRMPVTTAKQEA